MGDWWFKPEDFRALAEVGSGLAEMAADFANARLKQGGSTMTLNNGLQIQLTEAETQEILDRRSGTTTKPATKPIHKGSVVRQLRIEKTWTQAELAEKLETYPQVVASFETGKRPIGKAMAIKLGKAFGVYYTKFL